MGRSCALGDRRLRCRSLRLLSPRRAQCRMYSYSHRTRQQHCRQHNTAPTQAASRPCCHQLQSLFHLLHRLKTLIGAYHCTAPHDLSAGTICQLRRRVLPGQHNVQQYPQRINVYPVDALKSISTAVFPRTITFSGLMSRWTIPFLWRSSSASQS